MSSFFWRAPAALLALLLLAACPAREERPVTAADQGEAALAAPSREQLALRSQRPPSQWLYPPLYPSDRTPRLTSLGDFDTPRAYQGRTWRHRGIDIDAPSGTPVIAVSPGRACALKEELHGTAVLFFPRQSPEGPDLVIPGEGRAADQKVWIRYAHLRGTAPLLKPCAEVEMGTVLGLIGRSGIASQPHLHFEVLVRDPAAYPGDPALGGGINPFWLMRREPGQVPGAITCYEAGMAWRPNAGEPANALTIVWPTEPC